MEKNQIKVGVVLSYISEGVHILSTLVYTPILLRLLGQSEYGLYQLVYSVVSYLNILSLGFSSSYMRFFSREKAKKSEEGIMRLNGMFLIIFSVIAVISLLCGIVMLLNISSIFRNGLNDRELSVARILMILMVINVAITFITSVFDCVVTAHERFVFQKCVIILQYLFNPILSIPLLVLGYGSIGVVVVSTVVLSVKLIGVFCFCFKRLKFRWTFKNLEFGMLKEMWVFTFFIFLNQIVNQVNLNIDKFLLGRFNGTLEVAIYGVGSQLNSIFMQFSTAISNVFVPRVNKYVAENRGKKEISDIFISVGRIQCYVLALVLSGYIYFGRTFIYLWAGAEYATSYFVGIILMAPAFIPMIQNIGVEIQRAMNKHQIRTVVYLCIAAINLGISIPLSKLYGACGAAFGTLVALILGNTLFMNYYYKTGIGIDITRFWKSIISIIAGCCPAFIGGFLISKFLLEDTWISMIICIVFYTLIYTVCLLLFSMSDGEKKTLTGILTRKRRNRMI